MARPRPRRALRAPLGVRLARVVVPTLTAGAVAVGIAVAASPAGPNQVAYPAPVASVPTVTATAELTTGTSRDLPSRTPLAPTPTKSVAKPKAQATPPLDVVAIRYASEALNLRLAPSKTAKVHSVIPAGTKLSVTATVRDGFRFVAYAGRGRWVTERYLSKTKPDPASSDGISTAPCASGSAVERGLTKDAIRVHRAICARFPQVTSFGGRRGSSDFHGTGQALDSMISDSAVGWQIAKWVRAHARQLGVSQVIYSQHIWTVQRGSEGWRPMPDRGSRTANHYDHVHVSVYGNRGTG